MRTRITIQTTEQLDRALEQIRVATGRASKSEVIRDGLELYDLVVHHLRTGKHLYLGAAREAAGEVLLPHLERAAGRLDAPVPVVARDTSRVLTVVPEPPDEAAAPAERAEAKRRVESP